ncbi:unnamed protein product [Rotaria sp. Silwood2]|nr:unnamed protein product [Rotaria sp. Silwood2]
MTLVIAAGLFSEDFDIEVLLYSSSMHRIGTNMMTVTTVQQQSILSKTTAARGGINLTYIHRDQAPRFVAKYVDVNPRLSRVIRSSISRIYY